MLVKLILQSLYVLEFQRNLQEVFVPSTTSPFHADVRPAQVSSTPRIKPPPANPSVSLSNASAYAQPAADQAAARGHHPPWQDGAQQARPFHRVGGRELGA